MNLTIYKDNCPVCGVNAALHNNYCRGDGNLVFCRTETTDVPGWRCLGETNNSVWFKFVPTGGEKKPRSLINTPVKKQPVDLEAIARLYDFCSLSTEHKDHLKRRGVTNFKPFFTYDDEILPIDLQKRLPAPPFKGLYIPCNNAEGVTMGYQIKNTKTGDYRWLSKNQSCKHNGEFPISVAKGTLKKDAVILCEGTLKPLVARDRLGFNFIGAAAGYHHLSHSLVTAAIEALKVSKVYFAPDAGTMENRAVLLNVLRQCRLFNAVLLDWGQLKQGNKQDIDELEQ
jgi:hypothetical protein